MRRRYPYARVALSIAGCSLLAAPFAMPASAVSTAQCTKLVSGPPAVIAGVPTRTATLAGCTPRAGTGGHGTTVIDLRTMVSRTTWAAGHGTTIATIRYRSGFRAGSCPRGAHLVMMIGTVTGGTGAARAAIGVGHTLTAPVCATARSTLTLEPGAGLRLDATATPAPTTTTTNDAPTTSTTRPPTTTTTVPNRTDPPPPVPIPAGVAACPTAANSAMLTLVNRDRHQTGSLPPLTENANLDWAARKHSIMMASTSTMTHNGWDTEIAESHFVLSAPAWTGQNIAWMSGGYAPDTIESMFFNEVPPNDGHRLNILSTNFHKIGISCMTSTANGRYWWTQDFGS